MKPKRTGGKKKSFRKVRSSPISAIKKLLSSRQTAVKKSSKPKAKAKTPVLKKSVQRSPILKNRKSPKQTTNLLETAAEFSRAKFSMGTAVEEHNPEEIFKLPERYFDDRITAMVKDPWWIHTYWDISPEREKKVLSFIPKDEQTELKRVLRVYDITGIEKFTGSNANYSFDININSEALNWYINTANPGHSFCIDIGFLSKKGKFYLLARSNTVSTYKFGISPVLDEEWAIPEDEYFKILGIYDLGKSSMERRKKFHEIFKRQISSLGGSESFSPVKKGNIPRKFFLEVATDLIIYGKTEPSAKVTLKGNKVSLNKDGTFSFRFSLPIGEFNFPVTAVSSSGKDKITITPTVKRNRR